MFPTFIVDGSKVYFFYIGTMKERKPVPQSVRLTEALKKEIRRAARANGISQQDAIRMGLIRGLPLLASAVPALSAQN